MELWELVARESIRQLMADYTAATDRFDLQTLAACFAPTGVLEFTGGAEPLRGRDAIVTGLTAALRRPAASSRKAPAFVRHHVGSPQFGAVGHQRAEADSYFAVYTDAGADHWGRYRDILASVDGRWLFAHRTIAVDAFSPTSLMAG
ncbi:nuclear transport factor 2 family protein [Mycolicibacterium sp. 120266]|uniref:nuclear transport factor 2 family protein n=1 Tax=Mycolicibacterium sp. 120266 TaxID=3090601 RepID=UPI00299E1793|nr:nuclear transport factor 2 family protein [Mycolicibacterium sp. 120266]MDX1873873.1 nuclear transport factor 2 family protein [Mycolicibacterium sp. 120266]